MIIYVTSTSTNLNQHILTTIEDPFIIKGLKTSLCSLAIKQTIQYQWKVHRHWLLLYFLFPFLSFKMCMCQHHSEKQQEVGVGRGSKAKLFKHRLYSINYSHWYPHLCCFSSQHFSHCILPKMHIVPCNPWESPRLSRGNIRLGKPKGFINWNVAIKQQQWR